MNAPYKVSIINEETLSEALVVHLTKKSVYIFLSTLFVSLFILFSMLILFTPLRYYIPGNSNNLQRSQLIKMQKLTDSLVKINNIREKYIYNLITVANGSITLENDTTTLTQAQIEQALINNNAQIDRAKKYDYLKSIKKDTSNVENVGKKDSL